MDTEVVIPAAGLGTRLGDHKNGNPKCLVDLGDETILEYQLSCLEEIGISRENVYVVIGTTGDCWTQEAYRRIITLHDQVVVNFENTKRGPAFTLQLGVAETSADSLILLDGDVVVQRDCLAQLYTDDRDSVIASRSGDSTEEGTKVLIDDAGRVDRLGRDISPASEECYIYGGFCKLGPEAVANLKCELDRTAIADQEVVDLLAPVCRRRTVYNRSFDAGWQNVNNPTDLQAARRLAGRT